MEGELAKLRTHEQRDALGLCDLHEVPLDGDRSLGPLDLRDLNADDLRLHLWLRLRRDVSGSGDRGRYCKCGDDGSNGGDALHMALPCRLLRHVPRVRGCRDHVVRARDAVSVTAATEFHVIPRWRCVTPGTSQRPGRE